MVFRTTSPVLDTDDSKASSQILAYTEELRREMEAKLTAMEQTIRCIKEQIEIIKEVIA